VGIRLVVVHGGGPQLTEAMSRAGVEPTFVAGLRVTDDDAMEVVRRVLVGSINSDLVACLAGAGLRAVGLSGSDGAIFSARRTSGPGGEDLGRVGIVTNVDASLIGSLLDDGYVPVIAPVAPDDDGHALNVNADTVAGAVAGALVAAKLVFMTNVEGLFRDLGDAGSLVSEMTAADLNALIGTLSAGMRPKAAASLSALAAGAGVVHILDGRVDHALLLEVFTDTGIGTQVLP
jgi:acetylglutamate kinase